MKDKPSTFVSQKKSNLNNKRRFSQAKLKKVSRSASTNMAQKCSFERWALFFSLIFFSYTSMHNEVFLN